MILRWIEDAEKKKKKISQTYQKALDSLNKYPLTIYSGHDCAILENVGSKIAQMLDEKLEKHLNERPELQQQICHKDKVSEVERKEKLKITELIRNVEAAFLANNSLPLVVDENVELQEHPSRFYSSLLEVNDCQDLEILEELLSSSAESDEDSFDKLVRKYDSDIVTKRKEVRATKRKKSEKSSPERIIDISQSPPTLSTPQIINSPVSTAGGAGRFRKFKTFDHSRSQLAGPCFASSPISGFLNVETETQNKFPRDEDEEIQILAAKYDFPSPIPFSSQNSSAEKQTLKKNSSARTKKNQENLFIAKPQHIVAAKQPLQEVEEDEVKYIIIDDINPHDYEVILLVDTQETSG